MPLYYKHISDDGVQVLVWHMTESVSQAEKLAGAEYAAGESTEHPRRRMHRLISAHLIHLLYPGSGFRIQYAGNGKPSVSNGDSLSISHSKHFIGVCYHPHGAIGLDLEEFSERILKIAPRFINEAEQCWVHNGDYLVNLYRVWGSKESMFKSVGGGGIDFKKNLRVEEPEMSSGISSGKGYFTTEQTEQVYKCFYIDLDDVHLVYTIAENTVSSNRAGAFS